jgi:hypothetical protein
MPAPASQDSARRDRISWTPSSALSVKVRYPTQPFYYFFFSKRSGSHHFSL